MKKYIILLLAAFTIMVGLMGATQYFMAREHAETQLLKKAERDMAESKRVDAVQAEVESAIRNVREAVQQALDNPDRYYIISTKLVKDNPHIVGAGIAFKPDYYESIGKDRLYAPYAYDEEPEVTLRKHKTSNPQIRTRLIGYDYTDRDWYLKPTESGSGMWTPPYVDKSGTHIIMCTYVEPVRDRRNQIVGVLFADVPMEDVSLLSIDVNTGLSRNGKISLIIQLVCLVVFFIIILLTIKASRHYIYQKDTGEKERLLAEIEKLKTLNRKLTERNVELTNRP